MSKLALGDSLLAQREVQRLLVISAVCFGGATWALEAILSRIVRGEPAEPLGGVYRLVESLLWVGASAIAIRVAERWPIESVRRDWRRVMAQAALAIALGPVWGILAYGISPYLMPWWHDRGMWGVVAKEAKGALLGYGVTTVLVHVIFRARRQRAREVAASAMERAAVEAQLLVRKLELQPASVLRAMDAIARIIPRDVDAANEALVVLADGMRRSLALTRVELVPLRDEIDAVKDALRLRALTVGPPVEVSVEVGAGALDALVPALLLAPIVDDLVGRATGREALTITLRAEPNGDWLLLNLIGDGSSARCGTEPLESATHRLEALFGADGALWSEERDGARVICIRVPRRAALARVS
jgi:hypothetical protein